MSYKILDLVQGSQEWLDARYNYITASDVPVLFDLSPYKTPLQLFEEKCMRTEAPKNKSKETLFAIGHGAEIVGRKWLVEKLGHDLAPAVVASLEVPELLASLDGFSEEESLVAEFKYVGKDSFISIKAGQLPPHHEFQVQAQLLVTRASKAVYFAMNPDGDAAMLDILPNPQMHEQIIKEVKAFMNLVKTGEAPEPSPRDYVTPEDSRFEMLRELKLKMDQFSDEFETLKGELAKEYTHPRIKAGGVLFIRSFRKGNVQYAKVPELKGLDLELYRGKSFETVSVKLEKKDKVS